MNNYYEGLILGGNAMLRNEIGPRRDKNTRKQKKTKKSYELMVEINDFVKHRNRSIKELKKESNHLIEDNFWEEDFEGILESFINNEYEVQLPIDDDINSTDIESQTDIEDQDNARDNIKNEEENIENLEEHNIDENKEIKDGANIGITKEIQNIRKKYIVGKLVGEDLFDCSNNLIIKKDSIITVEIIDRAEREGKLVELIIGMKLPERT